MILDGRLAAVAMKRFSNLQSTINNLKFPPFVLLVVFGFVLL
jgi:hypothetical protein